MAASVLSLRPDKTPATPEGVSCKKSDLATHSGRMFPSWFSGFLTDFADGFLHIQIDTQTQLQALLYLKTELFVTSSSADEATEYSKEIVTEPLERQKICTAQCFEPLVLISYFFQSSTLNTSKSARSLNCLGVFNSSSTFQLFAGLHTQNILVILKSRWVTNFPIWSVIKYWHNPPFKSVIHIPPYRKSHKNSLKNPSLVPGWGYVFSFPGSRDSSHPTDPNITTAWLRWALVSSRSLGLAAPPELQLVEFSLLVHLTKKTCPTLEGLEFSFEAPLLFTNCSSRFVHKNNQPMFFAVAVGHVTCLDKTIFSWVKAFAIRPCNHRSNRRCWKVHWLVSEDIL